MDLCNIFRYLLYIMIYTASTNTHLYELHGSGIRWRMEIWKFSPNQVWITLADKFPLDYDRRHKRLFMSEAAEKHWGVDGITALEKLTRKALGPIR